MVILDMSEKKEYLKVGSYTPPDENGEGEKIVREFYGQGMIFKDEDAFYNRPDDACYIPELSDTVYTRNSILQECNNQTDLAEEVFEAVDWQHVSSLLEDWMRNGELDTCKKCGKLFNSYDAKNCPYCGAEYKGGEE
nr:MAG TPA: zinc-ribbon containing domain protein [Caudoviricetes sp.]